MKKRTRFISFMAVVVLFAFTQMAMADYSITVYQNGYSNGGGGEFEITGMGIPPFYVAATTDVSKSQSFESFCLEHGETFSPGAPYFAHLNTNAVKGGVGPLGDPVSVGTADLYYQFATGTLAGYFGASRNANAGLLQQAIWMLEDEIPNSAADILAANNPFLNAMITKYGSFVNAHNDNSGTFAVFALNLYDANGTLAQDQLVVTPIPAAVWLLGTGLVGLIGIRRRKNS